MWLTFSLLAGFLYTGSDLLSRSVLKKKQDAWAFSFYFSAIGAIVTLPFAIFSFSAPNSLLVWLLMIGIGLLIVLHNFLKNKALNFAELSLGAVSYKLRLVFILVFGILVGQEILSLTKALGLIFALLAGVLIVLKFKKPEKLTGIYLNLFAAVIYALVITIMKYLFTNGFNSQTLTFFIFSIPAVLNFMLMPNVTARVSKTFLEDGKAIILACTLGAFANLAINYAYSLTEVTRVAVITESFLVLVFLGEHFVLKERESTLVKLLAVTFAILGAILVQY